MGKGKGLGLFDGTQGSGVNVNGQNYEIHQGKQDKHIEGTRNHEQELRQGRTPSLLTADAHTLLREFAGRTIGQHFCMERGQFFETTRFKIHYDSRGGAHIVPTCPDWMRRR